MESYVCFECRGTGLLCFIVNEDEKDNPDYTPIYDFVQCEHCGGKGYVEWWERAHG